jgi:hypothetical protein
VDVFATNHAMTTRVAYVQYFQDKKHIVLEAIRKSLAIITDQHTVHKMELAEHPRIANEGTSITPTIQTDMTSNCKNSSIPTGRYADVVKGWLEDESGGDYMGRWIYI